MPIPTLLDGIMRTSLGRQSFFSPGDPRIVGWVREAIEEGEQVLREIPEYDKIDETMGYILGEQLKKERPSYLPQAVFNVTKKSLLAHRSALTDLRPMFSYRSTNPNFKDQGEILDQLMLIWWMNSEADQELGNAIAYSAAAGSGDLGVEYDPRFNGGDNRFIARDPRDTLPIRPSRDRSVQTWEGMIIREARTLNSLLRRWPDKAHFFFNKDASTRMPLGVFTRFRRAAADTLRHTPFRGVVAALDDRAKGGNRKPGVIPELTQYRIYVNDASLNMTTGPVVMGDPTTGNTYTVQPGEPLYPRKRLMIYHEGAPDVTFDGPSPYWHGMFPQVRLQLQPWPWVFLGLGIAHDTKPLQDLINSTGNDLAQVFSQWVNRVQVADKNAVPWTLFKRLDPRKPNQKVQLNPSMGEGYKMLDGPQTPPWTMQWVELLFRKFDEFTGTANLQALLQARQVPSGDTIQKYFEALTPEIRSEGRQIEITLREAARMLMVNTFQFYTMKRRVMLLGEQGVTKADVDWDPERMVPAMKVGDENYLEELDSRRPYADRAYYFQKLFSFYVAPHSLLAINAIERKMLAIQLARLGYLDFWTLMETLEVPNVGAPPPVPLPNFQQMQPGQPQLDPATGVPVMDPATGQPALGPPTPTMEVRAPITIPERLMAQQVLGIGMAVSPAGRKASGQEPPHLKDKGDGEQTISESK